MGHTRIMLVHGDITQMDDMEAMVNYTDKRFTGKQGLDKLVHVRAGNELDRSIQSIKETEAILTPAYELSNYKYLIHTVLPTRRPQDQLTITFEHIMDIVKTHRIRSIAIPAPTINTWKISENQAIEIILLSIKNDIDILDTIAFVVPDDTRIALYSKEIGRVFGRYEYQEGKPIVFTKEEITKALAKNTKKAKNIIEDEDRFEKLVGQLEDVLKTIPGIGKYMTDISTMILLVRSFIRKEYTEAPMGSIVSIVAAMIYVVTPIDLIPDIIPFIGKLDDAAILGFVIANVHNDVKKYKKWRNERRLS